VLSRAAPHLAARRRVGYERRDSLRHRAHIVGRQQPASHTLSNDLDDARGGGGHHWEPGGLGLEAGGAPALRGRRVEKDV